MKISYWIVLRWGLHRSDTDAMETLTELLKRKNVMILSFEDPADFTAEAREEVPREGLGLI